MMMPTATTFDAQPTTAPRHQPHLSALRVLVADDQTDVIEAVRLLLESEGMRIIPATSPAQALEVVRTQNVHAALVDLNFEQGRTSGEQGLDLVTRLTQTDAMLPITVMTAWSSIGLALEAMRRGAKDFVEKPFDEARLVATLRGQAELCQALRRIAELEAQLAAATATPGAGNGASTFEAMRLREVEGQLVQTAMQKAKGNVSRAARALGLSRSALYRRLERHGLTTNGEQVR
ncbi:MAG: DNA-binding response regulator [Acidobacteria bacterium]|nr:DNA-binding response regulator [Acidobacteriota bacterium]